VPSADAEQSRQEGARGRTALPEWLEPELATLTKERFRDPAWIFERKLDGERCLAYVASGGETRLMSRNKHQITGTFPEITRALAAQAREDCVVDGEIVAFEGGQTRFERLQRRLGVGRPGEQLLTEVPVCYYLFDVLYAGGADLRPRPLRERKEALRSALSFDGPLRYTEHRDTDGVAYYHEACRDGWEGIIAKRADAPYRSGRTRDWLKFKCENGQEFVIGGFTDPQGSRSGFGALLLGYYDRDGQLVYAGKVGTGFDQTLLHSLHQSMVALERSSPPFDRGVLPRSRAHWIEPRLVGQVAFAEWTRDGQLRHPRFQGLRQDKDPGEVTREAPSGGRSAS